MDGEIFLNKLGPLKGCCAINDDDLEDYLSDFVLPYFQKRTALLSVKLSDAKLRINYSNQQEFLLEKYLQNEIRELVGFCLIIFFLGKWGHDRNKEKIKKNEP